MQTQAPRVVTTILSGEDVKKFDDLLNYYSKVLEVSVSSVIRFLVREEHSRLFSNK